MRLVFRRSDPTEWTVRVTREPHVVSPLPKKVADTAWREQVWDLSRLAKLPLYFTGLYQGLVNDVFTLRFPIQDSSHEQLYREVKLMLGEAFTAQLELSQGIITSGRVTKVREDLREFYASILDDFLSQSFRVFANLQGLTIPVHNGRTMRLHSFSEGPPWFVLED